MKIWHKEYKELQQFMDYKFNKNTLLNYWTKLFAVELSHEFISGSVLSIISQDNILLHKFLDHKPSQSYSSFNKNEFQDNLWYWSVRENVTQKSENHLQLNALTYHICNILVFKIKMCQTFDEMLSRLLLLLF